MTYSWKESKLGSLLEFRNGRTSPDRVSDGTVLVFGSNGVIGRACVSNAKEKSIVIGRVGSFCGSVYYSPNHCWVTDNAIIATVRNFNDPKFFFYLMKNLDLNTLKTGSGQPLINQDILSSIRVSIPDTEGQKAIAEVLSALDDKIELNCQMNETLEGIAQAIFKSWFIDFDPVKAKMAGRQPEGLSPEIATFFPDKLVDSPLGMIPEGWKIGDLSNILCQKKEKVQSSDETEKMPYVPIECIDSKRLGLQNYQSGLMARTSLQMFQRDDILFGAMRPYFHKVCIAPFSGTTRTTVFVLRVEDQEDFSFAAMALFRDSTIEYASSTSQGSTIPYAIWDRGLAQMPVIIPPKQLRAHYNDRVKVILEKISRSIFQQNTLTSIRDVLLPKLISGQLRVKDAISSIQEVL